MGRYPAAVGVFADRAQATRLLARPPRHAEGARWLQRRLVAGGRRYVQPAGVSLAGVGYGAGDDRAPRLGPGAGPSSARAGGTLAAARAGADGRGLAGEGEGRRAGRLVVRVRERHLSGHGRHRRGAYCPGADGASRSQAEGRGDRARRALARSACSRRTAAGARSTRTTRDGS